MPNGTVLLVPVGHNLANGALPYWTPVAIAREVLEKYSDEWREATPAEVEASKKHGIDRLRDWLITSVGDAALGGKFGPQQQ